jgi:hypothetical protein
MEGAVSTHSLEMIFPVSSRFVGIKVYHKSLTKSNCEKGSETSSYIKEDDFLNSCTTISFSRTTMFHGVAKILKHGMIRCFL